MTIQLALKLPDSTVAELDGLVRAGRFENRTHAVRAGVEAVLERERRRAIDEAFRAGFVEYPETADEVMEAVHAGVAAIEEEPWEKWW